jgi:hypothetical protein
MFSNNESVHSGVKFANNAYYRAGVPLIPEIHKNPDQQWQKKY